MAFATAATSLFSANTSFGRFFIVSIAEGTDTELSSGIPPTVSFNIWLNIGFDEKVLGACTVAFLIGASKETDGFFLGAVGIVGGFSSVITGWAVILSANTSMRY